MIKKEKDKEKLEVKYQKLKKRVAARIRATEKQRGTSPRLEQLSEALGLGTFERFVLLELIRQTFTSTLHQPARRSFLRDASSN